MFPVENPVYIFAIAVTIFFIAPKITRWLKLPDIIGLIIAGVLLGPNALNILALDSSIVLLGTVGTLYIMFLSGLGVNFSDFKQAGKRSLIFGLLTFAIPQSLGILTAIVVLQQNWPAAILLASMYASHTLLAYPIVSKLGLKRSEPVVVTVGGTLVTNFLALSILTFIAASVGGELSYFFWVKIIFSYLFFIMIMFVLMPVAGRWLFTRVENEGVAQFLLVLAWLFVSASIAQLLGIEPIIGAFFAGLSINRFIIHGSPLQNRIDFVGSIIFIPYFLIYVGMIVDLRILFSGWESWLFVITVTGTATAAKWLAAFFAQRLFHYTRAQRGVMFGLSNAQAVNTLAAVLVGYKLGLFGENILNGTIVMILFTCVVSAFMVEHQGRIVALQEETEKDAGLGVIQPDHILIPVAYPELVPRLAELAHLLKKEDRDTILYPLSVVKDLEDAEIQLVSVRKMLSGVIEHVGGTDSRAQAIARIDGDIPAGIMRTAKEIGATKVVIGWSRETRKTESDFNSIAEKLIEECPAIIVVGNLLAPLNSIKQVRLFLPRHAEREKGFITCLIAWVNMVNKLRVPARIYGFADSVNDTKNYISRCGNKQLIFYCVEEDLPSAWRNFQEATNKDEMLTLLGARPGSISWGNSQFRITSHAVRSLPEVSFVFFYPERSV
ncbi:MAG: cation:proton antiporter [Bacillota bacterium]|nr:cation:proton antiporter [Bacillota bacterium]